MLGCFEYNAPYVKRSSGSNMRIWAVSKVMNMQDGVLAIFDDSSFKSLTGHSFDQDRDFVFVMNGDEGSAGSGGSPGTYTTPSYEVNTKGVFVWGIGPDGNPNHKTGIVRVNIVVISLV